MAVAFRAAFRLCAIEHWRDGRRYAYVTDGGSLFEVASVALAWWRQCGILFTDPAEMITVSSAYGPSWNRVRVGRVDEWSARQPVTRQVRPPPLE